jgi:hypothetical protein
MRRLLKYLRFRTFLMVSWRPNLVFFGFSNQGFKHPQLPHECNSQSGNALGNHWASSYYPPCVRMCFTPEHTFGFMGPCISHLVVNPMLRLQHLSFLRTNGCGKHCWNSFNVKLIRFLWNYLTRWSIQKMAIHNVVGLLLRCVWATCIFNPFVLQHQSIDVIDSFNTSLNAQLSNKSFSLYAHSYVFVESSFTFSSIVYDIGFLLAMTKVGLWLTTMVCFK